jgi:hypothetical protein
MQITDITTFVVGNPWKNWVFVKVHTDEGLIGLGEATGDAVTRYYFAERKEILYFYMGYPARPQPNRVSSYGSAQAAAIQRVGERTAKKLGVVLPPHATPGHWAAGWVGGLQLLPGKQHRWIALLNASPTASDPADPTISREEPPPSLGGFAVCDEEWPVRGWRWRPQPIERIQDIPTSAIANGEGTNLWRQHLLILPDGQRALYYNSGSYGQEQLYMKRAQADREYGARWSQDFPAAWSAYVIGRCSCSSSPAHSDAASWSASMSLIWRSPLTGSS